MAPISPSTISALQSAKSISGPHLLCSESFILEFLSPPPELNATVLMRCTYLSPGNKQGKLHPQAPPLHLHFAQSETFLVTQGSVGTTQGWNAQDTLWHADMSPLEIPPWEPHNFWPDPSADGDSTVYVWAHPDAEEAMDRLFFENLIMYVSEASEGKVRLDPVQMMVTQHASATALVLFPTAWWWGPVRWWGPWVVQAGIARVGRAMGYRALMERYTRKEEWEEYVRAKRM